jgi:hypothetical protein
MKTAWILIALSLMLVGCAPAEEGAEREAAPAVESSEEAASAGVVPETESDSEDEMKSDEMKKEAAVGMEMSEVKSALGAPDDSRHEHGDGGAELDVWVYSDLEVKFVGGKVAEVVKL